MNAETKQAILDSIAHWERMRDDWEGCRTKRETPTGYNCPLCKLHYTCTSCPVKESTGVGSCLETPYTKALNEWKRLAFNWPDRSEHRWKTAAQKEIDFLKGLLP